MPPEVNALEVTVTAPVASFRNPLYAGVQVGLPCPPPATVGGMLAAAAGGWGAVDPGLRFAMAFRAEGGGEDLETYHPLEASGRKADPTPRLRNFLAGITLTVWLVDDVERWQRMLRRPVWPLRLGRSQDLVDVRARTVTLYAQPGSQGTAIVPGELTRVGLQLRLPTAVSLDRSRTRWDDYRYDPHGTPQQIDSQFSDRARQAVVLLPPTHPVHAGASLTA
jgi:CRISPR-associated endonuclease/helicase Cas3/CRISPR-associated protein Cas5t